MVKIDGCPPAGVMTGTALARRIIMDDIDRFLMALAAVSHAGVMFKTDRPPTAGLMTVTAVGPVLLNMLGR